MITAVPDGRREPSRGRLIALAEAGQLSVEILDGLDVVLVEFLPRDQKRLHLDDLAGVLACNEQGKRPQRDFTDDSGIGCGSRDPGAALLADLLDVRSRNVGGIDLDLAGDSGFDRAELHAAREFVVRRKHHGNFGMGAQDCGRLRRNGRRGVRVDGTPHRFFLDPRIGFLDLGPHFPTQLQRPETGDENIAGVELVPVLLERLVENLASDVVKAGNAELIGRLMDDDDPRDLRRLRR